MLTPDNIKLINEQVYKEPRTVKEISVLLKVSWITANKYILYLIEKYGILRLKVFKGGTRGALKIVYWNNTEGVKSGTAQQILFDKIKLGKSKKDFSPFDIYHLIDEEKRKAILEIRKSEEEVKNQDIVNTFRAARRQVFIFSGNLSFVNLIDRNNKIIDLLTELARRKINIKIICKVDLASINNIDKVLAINKALGYDAIDIKHCEQPLRGFIVDDKIFSLREEKNKSEYKEGEMAYDIGLIYEIYDKDWIEWMERVFWNIYNNGLPIEQRMKDLQSLNNSIINMK